MVEHFPTNMHMGAFVSIANLAKRESIPKINPTWDLKVLGSYLLVKNLSTTIQK
jgi:hypothetical protein